MSTKIEWTDRTWNPLAGCSQVSEGCRNCYAMGQAHRFDGQSVGYDGTTKRVGGRTVLRKQRHLPDGIMGERKTVGARTVWTGQVNLLYERLREPLHWRKPCRVFVNSMSDLFHEEVPDSYIDSVFATMEQAHWHQYQVLTKRSQRMRDYVTARYKGAAAPAHIWLGVSAEDQATFNARVHNLRRTPAIVQLVSLEPLLETVQTQVWTLRGFNWVIVGAESGPGARPMHPDWARMVRDYCKAAGVAFFMKQLSGPGGHAVKDMALFPDDLRIREYPQAQ